MVWLIEITSPSQGKLCEMHLTSLNDFAFCLHAGWRSRYRPTCINHFDMVGRTILCSYGLHPISSLLNMKFLRIPGVDTLHLELQFNWHFVKFCLARANFVKFALLHRTTSHFACVQAKGLDIDPPTSTTLAWSAEQYSVRTTLKYISP